MSARRKFSGAHVWGNRTRPRRIAVRDWWDGRDEGGFEVRSSRFSELRTPNFGSRPSRASRTTVCGADGLFQYPAKTSPYPMRLEA
jgi:hypothetical protein